MYCVDAKLNLDDCAAYRQKRIFALDERSSGDEREEKAQRYNLQYVPLDGTIACMGAFLEMKEAEKSSARSEWRRSGYGHYGRDQTVRR